MFMLTKEGEFQKSIVTLLCQLDTVPESLQNLTASVCEHKSSMNPITVCH